MHNDTEISSDTSTAPVNNTTSHQSQETSREATFSQVELQSDLNVPTRIMMDQYDINGGPGCEPQPFGNLSVEEIWNWMMISGLDEQQFNG